MRMISLSDMKKGERVVIKSIGTKGELRRRLMDIGFVEGTKVKCVRISPFGDPKAYLVRGTVMALRKESAKEIMGVGED
ncbi:MAG: ferrous iron transport protein A [Oscillospiraceae bacterium]|nr:ferrous iron transport protein A [Oscillospiraceae bacterium]